MGALISILLATMVYLERCNTLEYNEDRLPGAQILRGSVRFRHENALMYCDSAYFYEKTNSLTAFSHVRMVQGDTLFGYGDVLYYNGNTKLARFRHHVRLVHRQTTLHTDSLNYDRGQDLAWYYTGGVIEDSLNTLNSVWGQYRPNTSESEFRHDVVLVNEKYTLKSDILLYNTKTKIAQMVSPTEIIYEGETTILSSLGWYNTEEEKSMLLNRSQIIQSDGKFLTGDTIYYDKKIGYRQTLGQVISVDSVEKHTLTGDYAEMYEEHNRGYVTKRALMTDWSDSTHITYMHADTLFSEDHPYTLTRDSITTDTVYREVQGHHNVRVYREDAQAVCGLAIHCGKDSTIRLYKEPICWSDGRQMSADSVTIYMTNNKVDHIHGMGNALIVERLSDAYYNQMAGKELDARMEDDELRQMDISGNAQTIFYPDDDGALIGMNTTESSFIKMFMKDKKMDHVVFTSETTGTLYPLDQVPMGSDRLSSFFWAADLQPISPEDVLVEKGEVAHPKAAVKSAANTEPAPSSEPVATNEETK